VRSRGRVGTTCQPASSCALLELTYGDVNQPKPSKSVRLSTIAQDRKKGAELRAALPSSRVDEPPSPDVYLDTTAMLNGLVMA
jgi:hypothetical protein